MIPLHLHIENFQCHEESHIDFTQFRSALVVGKIEGNDNYSNGVGKSTIFKSIEYVLFNMADCNLEKLIRDDTSQCKVTFIFKTNDGIFLIARTRTKKGSADLSLFERNAEEGSDEEVYGKDVLEKYWKDISGRRTPDTEKDLEKIIKINSKAFRNAVHFAQNDFSGLTTTTPEKRKTLLKEALSLSMYSKLEKMGKEKFNSLNKEIDKNTTIIQVIGSPEDDVKKAEESRINTEEMLFTLTKSLDKATNSLKINSEAIRAEQEQLDGIINENKSNINRKEKITQDKSNIAKSIKDFSDKRAIILSESKDLSSKIKKVLKQKDDLQAINFQNVNDLSIKLEECRNKCASLAAQKSSLKNKISELEIPLPEGSSCKSCRQELTSKHVDACKKEITLEIRQSKDKLQEIDQLIVEEEKNKSTLADEIKDTTNKQSLLKESVEQHNSLLSQIKSKKELFEEYNKIVSDFEKELADKQLELDEIEEKLRGSSLEKTDLLKTNIKNLLTASELIQQEIDLLSKQISSANNSLAVLDHTLELKKKEIVKKEQVTDVITSLTKEREIYPKVIESFSSIGIPNLIIQNLLDDLQLEANKILNNLKPGLQLQFLVEKEKKNGEPDDTLDILYFVQGKPRAFQQLSGAMQLSVNFALKIGLSFLLQKTFDTNINFLLLDEIDQSLDKAAVSAFADIVKFFQKDFTILVVTHNNDLKDKFNTAVLVEQNKDMISSARVVTSW